MITIILWALWSIFCLFVAIVCLLIAISLKEKKKCKRIKLTIDKDQIDPALSNFPVRMDLSTTPEKNNIDADVSAVFDELASGAGRKTIIKKEKKRKGD